MRTQKATKITISLPASLLQVADRLAKKHSSTRSGVIAELPKKEENAEREALMAQGYREWGEENLREAEEALGIISEVALRDSVAE